MSGRDDYQHLVNIASQAARIAGDQALRQMGQAQASIKQGPTGEELVTQIDRESQTLIVETLKRDSDAYGFIGEEGEPGHIFKQAPASPDGIWWIVDPIDGTNNFAHGLGLFAVSIGAMQNGRPVAGVIYCPALNELFTGTLGGSALCNGQPIHCSDDPISLFTSIGLDSHFDDTASPWMIEIMSRSRFRSLGSAALHMAYVASGAFVGNIICVPKLWDIAAGAVIVQCAGARTTDYHGNDLWPISLEDYEGETMPCVVANSVAHQELLQVLTEATT